MVYNFPCEPFPKCLQDARAAGTTPDRIEKFQTIKRIYQEGLIYFMEKNFINSYLRFLDTQRRTEELLEEVSHSYVMRAEKMMRDSIEMKDPKKETDRRAVDITIEFGKKSKIRRDFAKKREAPDEARRYNPRLTHYMYNKYRIEKNMEMGYYHLGLAKKVRLRALTVDSNLAAHQKLLPRHRRIRIEYYIASVQLSRMAKINAEFIFNLKYPYDKYSVMHLPNRGLDKLIQGGKYDSKSVPALESVRMNWLRNPYYLPKKLHPIFNTSLPAAYRRDASDVRLMVYKDEVDSALKFKVYKKHPTKILSGGDDKKKTK